MKLKVEKKLFMSLNSFFVYLFVITLVKFAGHEYGVCCPASSEIKKPGNCPSTQEIGACLQGHSCANDLQCPATLKCCPCAGSGEANTCVQPHNLTGRESVKNYFLLLKILIVF